MGNCERLRRDFRVAVVVRKEEGDVERGGF
jgi:hypothetical protein